MAQQTDISKIETTQTAVEWLVNQVNSDCLNSTFIRPELIKEAKAMEKEQLNIARLDGINLATKGYGK